MANDKQEAMELLEKVRVQVNQQHSVTGLSPIGEGRYEQIPLAIADLQACYRDAAKSRNFGPSYTQRVHELESELARVRGLLQRQWISVEERLPEQVGCYLVFAPGRYPYISDDGKGFAVGTFNGERFALDVRHWMSLPSKPNGSSLPHKHTFAESESVGLYQCVCGQYAVPQLVTVGDPSPTFPQSSSLVSQGAESADIGKLDTADEKGDRCDYQSAAWRCTLPLNHSGGHSPFMDEFAGGEKCPDCQHSLYHHVTEGCAYMVAKVGVGITESCLCGRPRPDYIEKESARVAALPMEERCKLAGSAETGGEKAAPKPVSELLESYVRLKLIDADRLAEAVDKAIGAGLIGSRTPVADARLNYGTPLKYEFTAVTNFRQSSSLSESGAESVQPEKLNTADKSVASPELLPTQLPKEK